jgi:hypothetical protein
MLVLVEDAAEPVSSEDVELIESQPVQQRRQQNAVRRGVNRIFFVAQLAFQNRDLMPQSEDLRVLVPIARGRGRRAAKVFVAVR